jgi:2Fe-2S ferredoxin
VPTITFLPSGVTIEVAPGTTVFNAAARAEVAIPSQCGGKCACALCRVTVVGGAERLSPMRWEEEGHMGNAFFLTRERLSCQLQVFGDVVIEVSEEPSKEKPKGRYIPYSLIRKREALEQAEELRRVLGDDARSSERPRRSGPKGPPPPEARPEAPKRPRRRRRPSSGPRPGDSRPPKKADSRPPKKAD